MKQNLNITVIFSLITVHEISMHVKYSFSFIGIMIRSTKFSCKC